MTISLTITAADSADLRRQLADLLGTTESFQASPPRASAPRAAPKVETPASDPSPAPSDTSQTTQSEVTTTAADGGAATTSPSDAGSTLTYDGDIKPAVLRVSAKHGRPGVEKLLAGFEVANAKEVPEARWPEFLAEIEKLLG